MDVFRAILTFLRENCFSDLRTSIITICGVLGFIFLYKLLKDKGDKVNKTMQYLTGTAVFFTAFASLV